MKVYSLLLLFQRASFWGTTVYEIGDCMRIPHIRFNLGDTPPDYTYRDMPEKNKDTYQLGMVMETDTRVYFSYNVDQETFGDITVRVMAKLMLLYYPLKTKLRAKAKTVISSLHETLAPKQSPPYNQEIKSRLL